MLIIEDGNGLPDADSYVSLDDADIFWSDRGQTQWAAASDAVREAALRQGFDYLALAYAWPGQMRYTTQRGMWPRDGIYDRDGLLIPYDAVPVQVQTANILLGLEALGRNILSAPTDESTLIRKSVSLPGGLSIDRQYSSATQRRGLPRFATVDAALNGIGAPRGSTGFRVLPIIRA